MTYNSFVDLVSNRALLVGKLNLCPHQIYLILCLSRLSLKRLSNRSMTRLDHMSKYAQKFIHLADRILIGVNTCIIAFQT